MAVASDGDAGSFSLVIIIIMLHLPIIDDFREVLPEHECPYLPNRSAKFDYRVVYDLTEEQYDHLLERGWRRHGLHIFRPLCDGCSECRSLRIPVVQFRPSKSQRRTIRRNSEVRCVIQRPSITDEHIDLFNRYHADMTRRRQWREHSTNVQEYFESFLCGQYAFEREFLYFSGDQLIGVGLVDATKQSASSIYFFHDPEWRSKGLGVFSMLAELNYAAQMGIRYHYLGYWVEPCPSMAYKSQYRPHEILSHYVDDEDLPVWKESTS